MKRRIIPTNSMEKNIVVILLALGVALIAGAYTVLRLLVFPTFEAFEKEQILSKLAGAKQAIISQQQALAIYNFEYSAWDDTYEYIQQPESNTDYIELNMSAGYWSQIDIEMMLFFDRTGHLVWGNILHPVNAREVPLEAALGQPLSPDHPLVQHDSVESSTRGLLNTHLGVLMVTSYPIVKSDESGPIMGTVVVGRFLNAARLKAISAVVGVEIMLYDNSDPDLPGHIQSALQEPAETATGALSIQLEDFAFALAPVRDILDSPFGVIEVRMPATIRAIGTDTMTQALSFLGLVIALFILVALLLLRRQIIEPMSRLKSHISTMRRSGNLDTQFASKRQDEIGELADEFDTLANALNVTQLKLEQSRDDAEASSNAKSEFLANMSHEIRTPMNGVIGMTEFLLQTELSATQQRLASTLKSSGHLLLNIINDILDFSKIKAGMMQLHSRVFSVHELIEDVNAVMGQPAEMAGITYHCHIGGELPEFILADDQRITRVLINLIGNAIKFTQLGEVVLSVDCLNAGNPQAGDQLTLRFTVADTGVGISDEVKASIFEAFSQGDTGTTREYGGTGLGLAICKQLVDLMGGEISVESVYGEGAVFQFTVPVQATEQSATSTSGKEEATSSAATAMTMDLFSADEQPPILHPNILVAEDNMVNQDVMALLLERMGARVVRANDGQIALTRLQEGSFDMVIMDCQMPVMDGFTATRAIREMAITGTNGKPIPILAVTANATANARQDCTRAGMDAYISKPFDFNEMHQLILSLLPRHTPAETVLEREALDKLSALQRDGEPNILNYLIDTYLETSPKLLEELNDGISRQDSRAIELSAHSLKSSSANFGASKLADCCRQLEELGRASELDQSVELMEKINAEYNKACDALSREKCNG